MMNFLGALKETNRSHWREAGLSLAYSIFGSLAPVWGGFLLLRLFSRRPGWVDFSQHGEFALYSAAMLAPALYVVSRDLKVPGFAGRSVLILLCFLGIFVATCFFVAVTTAFMAPTPILKIDQPFLSQWTLVLFCLSCCISIVVAGLDQARVFPDIRETEARERKRLNDDFDRLEDTK